MRAIMLLHTIARASARVPHRWAAFAWSPACVRHTHGKAATPTNLHMRLHLLNLLRIDIPNATLPF